MGVTAGLALTGSALPSSAQLQQGEESVASGRVRTIETTAATLRISERTGDLVGLRTKDPEIEVIGEPRLGENFRILLPKPGYEAAYFNSRDQEVSQIDEEPNGVLCTYRSLRRGGSIENDPETVPLTVRYRISAIGNQIRFSIEVDNPTNRKLAEVMYGIIGGQQGIGNRIETDSMVPGMNLNMAPKLFSQFNGGSYGGGNLGIRYDSATFSYPGYMSMGWIDVSNSKEDAGYYYANHDIETRLCLLAVELRPFHNTAAVGDNWPTVEEAQGEPIGLTIGWVHFPYSENSTFKADAVVFEAHKGDWHDASRIYRSWFDQHFPIRRPKSWLRQEHAWQSVIVSNGEDVVRYRFNDLPKLAADAKQYGITTFEILGWDVGGIDRGYPQYRPDPRLGTAAEFRKALADIREMGVHPLIFTNIQVADTATEVFRNSLKQYAVDGLWAQDWQLFGWGEGTISARANLTESEMTLVSPSHPEFREYLMKQYLQLVRDGAEGFQFDKATLLFWLDFNSKLPVSPDRSLPAGILETYKEVLSQGRAINPSLAIASETWLDRAFQYVDVSYLRMGDIDMNSTVLKYTFPEWTCTIFGELPGDFVPMNNGMRYGLVWDLAPRHYNDSVDEKLTRPLARYVRELIRIRKKYADLLFHGRFNDTIGAQVKGSADIRHSVFLPMEPGNTDRRACVVVNFGNKPESVDISLEGITGEVTIAQPFQPDRKISLPARILVPPRRLAVVVKS
jgi:hypothetical protein